MHKYRRKSIMFLMGYLLMFFAVLIISLYNLNRGQTLFYIGMSSAAQNWIIIIFSVLAMIRVVVEIAKTEGHAEYEKKLRELKTY